MLHELYECYISLHKIDGSKAEVSDGDVSKLLKTYQLACLTMLLIVCVQNKIGPTDPVLAIIRG